MGTFSGTETDWHDVAFSCPGELTLPENQLCIEADRYQIKQGISQEEVQLQSGAVCW